MEKESITITITAENYQGDKQEFKDYIQVVVEAHRDEISKKFREFVDIITTEFEQ